MSRKDKGRKMNKGIRKRGEKFHLFPKLTDELKIMIWQHTYPDPKTITVHRERITLDDPNALNDVTMLTYGNLLVEPHQVPAMLQVDRLSRQIGEERYKLLFGRQLLGEKAIRFDPEHDTLNFQDHVAITNFVESRIGIHHIEDLHHHFLSHGPLFHNVQNMVIGGNFGFNFAAGGGHYISSNVHSLVTAAAVTDRYPDSIEGFGDAYYGTEFEARGIRHLMLMISWSFKNLKVLRFDRYEELKKDLTMVYSDVFEKGIGVGEGRAVLKIGGLDTVI